MSQSQVPVIPVEYVLPANSGCMAARVVNNRGTLITQASLTSIITTIKDVATGATVATVTHAKTDVVFDTLQTGDPWNTAKDALGFNLLLDWNEEQSPSDGATYEYDTEFTPAAGKRFRIVYRRTASERA